MKFMNVQNEWDHKCRKNIPAQQIPWDMISAHDEQAKRNHAGQDLERLRERHGLGACEALAILDDRPWKPMPTSEAHAELSRRITEWREKQGKGLGT